MRRHVVQQLERADVPDADSAVVTAADDQVRLALAAQRAQTAHRVGVPDHGTDQLARVQVEKAKLGVLGRRDEHVMLGARLDRVDLREHRELVTRLAPIPLVISCEAEIGDFVARLHVKD